MSNPEPPSGQPPPGWRPPPGTQPATGWQPPQGSEPSTGWSRPPGWQPGGYPQQTLSAQNVQRGRSRKPLIIGLVVVLVLGIGGVLAWQLLKDDGESTRAAYCSALRKLTNNGDLATAVSGADASTLNRLAKVQQLAPSAVKDDWDSLQRLAQSAQTGNVDYSAAIKALTSLRAIADDAKSKCSITMNVPGLR